MERRLAQRGVFDAQLGACLVRDVLAGVASGPVLDQAFVLDNFIKQREQCVFCSREMKTCGPMRVTITTRRISVGHTHANAVLCCHVCQQLRDDDYTYDEFQLLCCPDSKRQKVH